MGVLLTIIFAWGKLLQAISIVVLFLPILKFILLKTSICLFLLSALWCSCNFSSGSKSAAQPVVTTTTYAPPLKKLTSEEFNHYSQIASEFFAKHLLRSNFNGEILIAKNGNIVYEKYVGYADLRKKDSLTEHTPLHIASVSKTFTAMAILQLVQEKKLSLEDSLTKFFPGLPYPGITIKMLLSHRSGLPNYVHFIPNSKWNEDSMVMNNDVVDFLYNKQPAKSSPAGKAFSYSNTNFVLLAMIVEKISGQPFPEYMKQNIFDPLQMKDTYIFTLADSIRETPTFNYDGSFWQHDFLEGTYGDKNVYTTARDLLKWDQALYTDSLINRGLLDSAFTPYSFEHRSTHNYGLGWRLLIKPGQPKIIYHFGRWHGCNAAFARLTADSATIIILGNRYNRNIYTSAHDAYSLFGSYEQFQNGDEEEAETPTSPTAVRHAVKTRRTVHKKSSKTRRR